MQFYAIETFGSTGRGRVVEDGECSHYMRAWQGADGPAVQPARPPRSKAARDLLAHIDSTRSTLAFARRWLDDAGFKGHWAALRELCDMELVNPYPPLVENRSAYTAQWEHTLFLRPTCKEIISRGDDY